MKRKRYAVRLCIEFEEIVVEQNILVVGYFPQSALWFNLSSLANTTSHQGSYPVYSQDQQAKMMFGYSR